MQIYRQKNCTHDSSPWNIAADFNIDMNFSKEEIAGMLLEYETDYHTGMDISRIAELLFDYTSGYPFLVSRLCKLIDEEISSKSYMGSRENAWSRVGFNEAVKLILCEKNTLFESLIGKLTNQSQEIYTTSLLDKNQLLMGQEIIILSPIPEISGAQM